MALVLPGGRRPLAPERRVRAMTTATQQKKSDAPNQGAPLQRSMSYSVPALGTGPGVFRTGPPRSPGPVPGFPGPVPESPGPVPRFPGLVPGSRGPWDRSRGTRDRSHDHRGWSQGARDRCLSAPKRVLQMVWCLSCVFIVLLMCSCCVFPATAA